MLGLVFSEFMDMVEDEFPDHVFDTLLEIAEQQCESAGEYTAVGNYDHVEMLTLVKTLSDITDVSAPDLVQAYGRHLFGRFHAKYPEFFVGVTCAFDFLKGIEDRIHVEVRKLYPHAELPNFHYEEPSDVELILNYSSIRPFAKLALGLIQGCVKYYDENVLIDFQDLSDGTMTKAKFHLTLQ